ncbi:hypothetical protein [Sinorhizobium sp. BG8]|uniref:hypothetical protein n=1 Tax=Sinorhizobium sp. BG8 TaxID=2613773 RepID=UPI00193EBFFF|nr:hypothetical protein [Sinorhizobium sp. BG8]QRM53447.1 hypothetical protein F3Y30_01870 [Sinorhizobium sp. BG8]
MTLFLSTRLVKVAVAATLFCGALAQVAEAADRTRFHHRHNSHARNHKNKIPDINTFNGNRPYFGTNRRFAWDGRGDWGGRGNWGGRGDWGDRGNWQGQRQWRGQRNWNNGDQFPRINTFNGNRPYYRGYGPYAWDGQTNYGRRGYFGRDEIVIRNQRPWPTGQTSSGYENNFYGGALSAYNDPGNGMYFYWAGNDFPGMDRMPPMPSRGGKVIAVTPGYTGGCSWESGVCVVRP